MSTLKSPWDSRRDSTEEERKAYAARVRAYEAASSFPAEPFSRTGDASANEAELQRKRLGLAYDPEKAYEAQRQRLLRPPPPPQLSGEETQRLIDETTPGQVLAQAGGSEPSSVLPPIPLPPQLSAADPVQAPKRMKPLKMPGSTPYKNKIPAQAPQRMKPLKMPGYDQERHQPSQIATPWPSMEKIVDGMAPEAAQKGHEALQDGRSSEPPLVLPPVEPDGIFVGGDRWSEGMPVLPPNTEKWMDIEFKKGEDYLVPSQGESGIRTPASATNEFGAPIESTSSVRDREQTATNKMTTLRNKYIHDNALYEMEKGWDGNMVAKVDEAGRPVEKQVKTVADWERRERMLGNFDNVGAAEINARRKDFLAEQRFDKAVESGNERKMDLAFGEMARRTAMRELGKTDFDAGVEGRTNSPLARELHKTYTGKLERMTKAYKDRDLAKHEINKLAQFSERALELGNKKVVADAQAEINKYQKRAYEAEIEAIAVRNGIKATKAKADGITIPRIAAIEGLRTSIENDQAQAAVLAPVLDWYEEQAKTYTFTRSFYNSLPDSPTPKEVRARLYEAFRAEYNANPEKYASWDIDKTSELWSVLSQGADKPSY